MGNMLSVAQASKILNIHEETCRKRIRKGIIPASKPSGSKGNWRIDPNDLESSKSNNQNTDAQEVRRKELSCRQTHSHSTNVEKSGGIDLHHQTVETEYLSLLGL